MVAWMVANWASVTVAVTVVMTVVDLAVILGYMTAVMLDYSMAVS